jgi:uncharacterized iron-regulated membrane protein
MKTFRSVLFWTHLTAGVLASAVILTMSFTGAVLALKPQIQAWIERDVRIVTPLDSPRLGAHELLTAVKEARPGASPQSLALPRDPAAAATVSLGRDGNVYVNPYTGAILGSGSARTNEFFQSMTSWHRYMGATGEYRATGRSFTGISNLAFLVLAVTGLYLWWPKQFAVQYLKPILWFRRTATGRARDFNWHNTIGFWCLIPIVIMTVSGAVLSYPWASNLVYQLTGSPIPSRGGDGGRSAEGAPSNANANAEARAGADAAARNGNGRTPTPGGQRGDARPGAGRQQAGERPQAGAGRTGRPDLPPDLNRIWSRAEQQVPTWSLLSMRLSERQAGPVAFTITDGANWNAFARSNLTLDSVSGDIIQWQPYEAGTLGQKVRGWLRFAHTGELGGLPGQVIAGIGCLGGVFLVYTGLALAFRRLWNWSIWSRFRSRGRRRFAVPVTTDAVAVDALETQR